MTARERIAGNVAGFVDDRTGAAKVIFGPAARPLPQLAITVDAEGYLVAQAPFNEPVGPSFWERSS